MKYYLVSPRVDGESPIDGFLKTMFARHIVMMGWGTDNKIGADFHDIRKGDFVLVAQRINWKFKYFFAGIVADSKTYEEDGFQYKKLIHFVDLRNSKMDFLTNASFAEMRVVKAMMAINKYNNSECVKHFDAIIQQQKHIEIMNNYISLLKTNHNLILTGAPGTGKTYLAKEIAKEMGCPEDEIGFVQFHPSYDYTDFVEGLRPVTDRNGNVGFERKDGVFKEFCKKANAASADSLFDDAYTKLIQDISGGVIKNIELKTKDSTDLDVRGNDNIGWFSPSEKDNKSSNVVSRKRLKKLFHVYNTLEKLEGVSNINNSIKSIIGGNDSSYYWGILHYLLAKNKFQTQPFVFIIDEINRGEISKIFGELFFSIDPGYRGEKGRVQTQYQNMVEEEDVFKDGFYVPENVYIIGTMNDIDRSVESMDFAMRRRFAWAEVTAKESYTNMIENDAEMVEVKDEIKQRMSSLNNAILNKKLGLGEAYQIGAAYFRKVLNYTQEGYGQEEAFQMLWDNHLKGLLFEYLRGNQNAKEQLEMLHQAYEKHDAQHEGQQGEGTDD